MSKIKILSWIGCFAFLTAIAACSGSNTEASTVEGTAPEVSAEVQAIENDAAELEAVDSEIKAKANALDNALEGLD